jgi:hypothetical protein
MPIMFFDTKGISGNRRERIEAAVVAGGAHTSTPYEAWMAPIHSDWIRAAEVLPQRPGVAATCGDEFQPQLLGRGNHRQSQNVPRKTRIDRQVSTQPRIKRAAQTTKPRWFIVALL